VIRASARPRISVAAIPLLRTFDEVFTLDFSAARGWRRPAITSVPAGWQPSAEWEGAVGGPGQSPRRLTAHRPMSW